MDVKIDRTGVQLVIEGRSKDVVRLFINDSMQADYTLGIASGPEDYRAKLCKANAAEAACGMMARVLTELTNQVSKPDHVVKPARRAAAYAAGLEAGLRGQHRAIGKDPMFNIKGSVVSPEHKLNGPSYDRGWHTGCAILAAVSLSQGLPDPRKVWAAGA